MVNTNNTLTLKPNNHTNLKTKLRCCNMMYKNKILKVFRACKSENVQMF